jgi:hypothetical protein
LTVNVDRGLDTQIVGQTLSFWLRCLIYGVQVHLLCKCKWKMENAKWKMRERFLIFHFQFSIFHFRPQGGIAP